MLLKKREFNPMDKRVVDNLRALSIDMIKEAGSGHSGICLGAAPIVYSVYANHLRFDNTNPSWINRDRFVMSAGHGSALLYSVLYLSGFDLSLDDIKSYRKFGSKTPGHPELGITPGVDFTTGPLGQGIASAVGMAYSSKVLKKEFTNNVIDFNVYCLCSDGDLMEGISYEACSFAGTNKLNNLILLYDSNNITLDGKLSNTFNEDIKKRFESMNWNYILVSDSEDLIAINDAIDNAKSSSMPTIIEVKTTIGKYSKYEGTNKVHGMVLEDDDITSIKDKLSFRDVPFQISDEATTYFRELIDERNGNAIKLYQQNVMDLGESDKEKFELLLNNKMPIKLNNLYYELPENNSEYVRKASGTILNRISSLYPFMIGGSCDTSHSTYVDLGSKNISFGVRELSAAAISNGIATVGLTPVVSTFLAFSDYMKPAIRMSALMNLPVIYVFTHDSITVGEDGPTHQAVEQLVSLRSIPNIDVYRPADVNEVLGAYNTILERRKPSVVVLSRNSLPILENAKANEVNKGAYIIKPEQKRLDATIISTGEEVSLGLEVAKSLSEKGIDIRVISMPSIELFNELSDEEKKELIPNRDNVFVIETSSSLSWYQFVKDKEHLFTVDNFGISASKNDILERYNFRVSYIEEKIEELLK